MNRSVQIALYEVLAEEHRVLIVIAFPRHISDEDIIPQRQFAVVGCRAVGNRLFLDDRIPFVNNRHLVNAGSLIGTHIFLQLVAVNFPVIRLDVNPVGGNIGNRSRATRQHHDARVASRLVFHARADQRSLRFQKRYRLTLHIRAH